MFLPLISPSQCRRASVAALLIVASLSAAEEEKKPETNVAVSVAKVVRTTLHAFVSAYGSVEPAPAAVGQPAGGARLAAGLPGLIVAVNAVEGARVEKGAVIVQLDARAADAAVLRAQAAMTAAEKSRARQIQLQAAEGSSERAMQEAEAGVAAARAELAAAQLQQSQLAIRAPLSGTVVRVSAKPGEWLDAGKDVAELVDLERLVVTAQIPAQETEALKLGQAASVLRSLGAGEKALAEGAVQFIAPQVNAANDSVLVRISVPAGTTLRPGQFVAVRVVVEEKPDSLAVPVESIFTDDGHATLAVVENGKAVRKPVRTGLREGDLIEVHGGGLAEGATVVKTGAYGLPKETAVTVRQP